MESVRYFDIETDGLHKAETRGTVPVILTNLDGQTPCLRDVDEKQLVVGAIEWLHTSSVPVIGKNLIWDLDFLRARVKALGGHFDLYWWLRSRKYVDVKIIGILLNEGRFAGYQKWIDRDGKPSGAEVPEWHKNNEWDRIIQYSQNERLDVLGIWEKAGKILREQWNHL